MPQQTNLTDPCCGLEVRWDLAQPLTARSLLAARRAAVLAAERRAPPAAGSLVSAMASAWRDGRSIERPATPAAVAIATPASHSLVGAVCRTVRGAPTQ